MDVKSRQSTQVLDPQLEQDLQLSGHMGSLQQASEEATNLSRLQLLWQQRRILGRCAIWGTVLFTVIAILIPPKYQSTTKLMPPESKASGGMAMVAALAGKSVGDSGIGSGLENLAGDMMGVKGSGALFIGMLHSRTVEDALIRRFDLRQVYRVARWEQARKVLEERTTVIEDRKSGIIEVGVLDKSAQRAQSLAQAYDEELDHAVNQLTISTARREREFLETRLTGVKKDLDQAAQNFSQYASQNTAIDIPAQSKAMFESAASLQGQLMAAEAEQQGLKQIYTPDNIRVRTLESRIVELRRQLQKMGNAGTGEDGKEGARDLSDSSESALYPSIRKLPLLGVKYFDLMRQARIQEALFDALTKKYEMAKVEEVKETPTVRVLDPANLPERKATPRRSLIVLIGLVLSLLAGGAWVIGTAAWDKLDANDSRKLFLSEISRDLGRDWKRLRLSAAKFTRSDGRSSGSK